MLYHLAYARPPFEADNFVSVISRHLGAPLEFPEDSSADIPAGFPDLIRRMMAKDPADRFQDYSSLESALRELLPELQVVPSVFRRATATGIEIAGLGALVSLVTGVVHLIAISQGGKAGTLGTQIATGAGLLALFSSQVTRGRTQGKEFARLRIANLRGGRPLRPVLALRWCLQWLPALALWLAFSAPRLPGIAPLVLALVSFWMVDHLWALWNRRRRTLHDIICGTWVLEEVRGLDPA